MVDWKVDECRMLYVADHHGYRLTASPVGFWSVCVRKGEEWVVVVDGLQPNIYRRAARARRAAEDALTEWLKTH